MTLPRDQGNVSATGVLSVEEVATFDTAEIVNGILTVTTRVAPDVDRTFVTADGRLTVVEGVGFDPLSVFTGSEKGILAYPLSAYTDTGQTILANANDDLVASLLDRSPNGNSFAQATEGNRPLFKTSVHNSKPGLEFTVAGRRMATGSFLDSSFNTACSLYAVVKSSGTGTKVFAASNATSFYVGRVSGSGAALNSLGLSDTLISTQAPGSVYLTAITYDGATKIIRNFGVDYQLTKSEAATGNLGLSGALTLGDLAAGGFAWDGQVLGFLLINRVLTTEEDRSVTDYFCSEMALYNNTLPRVVCDGNSLTTGVGATDPATQAYPAQMQALLPGRKVLNFGLSGQTTAQRTTASALGVDLLHNITASDVAVLWEARNDLYSGGAVADVITRYVSWCEGRRALGYKVVAVTILPSTVSGTPVDFETSRQTFNTSIRANWEDYADALADVAADSRIGDAGDDLDTTYYLDLLHLKEAGYAIVAEIVSAAVLSI